MLSSLGSICSHHNNLHTFLYSPHNMDQVLHCKVQSVRQKTIHYRSYCLLLSVSRFLVQEFLSRELLPNLTGLREIELVHNKPIFMPESHVIRGDSDGPPSGGCKAPPHMANPSFIQEPRMTFGQEFPLMIREIKKNIGEGLTLRNHA